MVRYLAWYEIKQNLRPARMGALLVLCMVLCYQDISQPFGPEQKQIQGALAFRSDWLWWVIALFSGWMGSSLAEERARGLTFTFFAKGASRRDYLLSKMLGAAASGALLAFAAIAGLYVQIGLGWPAGRIVQVISEGSPGPVPLLYAVSPLGHDMLVAAMRITSAAAWPLLGVLAGTFTANRYVALGLPAVVAIVGMVVQDVRSPAQALNPFIYFDLSSFYTAAIPAGLRPFAPFVYWACFALLLGALARWSFERRELP